MAFGAQRAEYTLPLFGQWCASVYEKSAREERLRRYGHDLGQAGSCHHSGALTRSADPGFKHARTGWIRCSENRALEISLSENPGYFRILHGALLEAAEILGAVATLEKPVTAKALAEKVREVLG
jgi:hypothetical protein